MCVPVRVCVYMCMCVHVYVCAYVCVRVYMCMCVCVYVCMCVLYTSGKMCGNVYHVELDCTRVLLLIYVSGVGASKSMGCASVRGRV